MDNQEKKQGKLFVVSTPIGNKDDISLRALSVIKICDFVLCEELKEGARFLKSINLQKEIESLNEQNEVEQSLLMLEKLEAGSRIALISDCGTPLFADPGQHLVRAAIKAKIEIEVVPGASSIMTALVRSGLDISSFLFAGFVSRKSDERFFELKELAKESRTVVLLETPYRFTAFLENAAKVMPDRNAYIGMNLTMPYETHHYGTFEELQEKFNGENVKAEFVVCFEGNPENSTFSQAADMMHREERPRFDRSAPRSGNRDGGNFAPKPFRSRDDRPSFKPRSGSSDRPYKAKFGNDSGRSSGFKPRFDKDSDRGGSDFKPRFRDNDSGSDFKPRFDSDNDRGGSGFKPRFDRDNDRGGSGFKPRFDRDNDRGGSDFKPRFDRDNDRGGSGFKPRFDRDNDRGGSGFKPRFDRDNDRGGSGFKPRFDRDNDRGGSDFKPRFDRDNDRGGSGFKPRFDRDNDRGGSGFKPRFDRDNDRGGSGFKPRFDRDNDRGGSGFKPRFDRDNDRGGSDFKPRFDKDSDRGGSDFKPRSDRDGGKNWGEKTFKKRDSSGGKSRGGYKSKSSGFKSRKRF